ncbi:hypothetical protein [Arthrobacter sp. JCM 19049]|uniref:hypothetical protein n=1 Tax=Arthrobacter sp. JCM 19049 TaxID=1460643 RepID=UPI000AB8530B|nr:hypothetical protein [Arthrobacter sp. JCM 19049]
MNLAQPWQAFDESVLFYTSTLNLQAIAGTEVPSPMGLVRSQVLRTPDAAVRPGPEHRAPGPGGDHRAQPRIPGAHRGGHHRHHRAGASGGAGRHGVPARAGKLL